MFGFILSLLTIALILCIFLYYIIGFDNGMDRRISYNKGLTIDPANAPPLQLNTNSNFRAAFGFYTKPNFAFLNVSNYLINTENSTL
jgi:hypothetical protein